ncbi:MAG TPA: LON peptidase substrate-binding domain-containing protein, partial [Nitrospiria bacterium]|nr:LON peptidase substrate-binding domain-containing protein [Nitrospiria bacterium]
MAEPQDKPTEHLDIPDELPLLPIRDLVVFPSMVLPLFVGREISVKAVEAAANSQRMILLVAQKTMDL